MKTCTNCNSTQNIQQHHIIPKSLGGQETIPLCSKCHGLVHNTHMSSSELVKMGIDATRYDSLTIVAGLLFCFAHKGYDIDELEERKTPQARCYSEFHRWTVEFYQLGESVRWLFNLSKRVFEIKRTNYAYYHWLLKEREIGSCHRWSMA